MPVSVIIPCYNEPGERVRATVHCALDAGACEVIVVDDGSDPPADLLLGVRLARQDHSGVAAALNRGVREATHDHVCWLSCGDIMYASKIQRQLAFMHEHDYLATFHRYDGERGQNDISRLDADNQFSGSTTMVHRSVFWQHGCWFDEALQYCQDWDWACRVHFDGPGWTMLDEVLGAGVELPGGHTDSAQRDPERKKIRDRDRCTVARRWRGRRRP